jgi:uncharacterized protein (TIGR02117 family)
MAAHPAETHATEADFLPRALACFPGRVLKHSGCTLVRKSRRRGATGFVIRVRGSCSSEHEHEKRARLERGVSFRILLVLLLACACARPMAELPLAAAGGKRIAIVNYGWHTSIVMNKGDIAEDALPEVRNFPEADYLEFGWGDWDYYQAPDPGLGLAFKAAFWSNRSVLHVAGFKGSVEAYFRGSEIASIMLPEESFHRLVQFVSATFSRPHQTTAQALSGPHAHSRFYPATGRFHLFRNCNTWVAEALRSAGLPVRPALAFTAGNLSYQTRQFATIEADPG